MQIIHLGSPCEDLSRLLGMCTDRENRTPEYTDKLVTYYLDEFEKALHGKKLPFDRAEFHKV